MVIIMAPIVAMVALVSFSTAVSGKPLTKVVRLSILEATKKPKLKPVSKYQRASKRISFESLVCLSKTKAANGARKAMVVWRIVEGLNLLLLAFAEKTRNNTGTHILMKRIGLSGINASLVLGSSCHAANAERAIAIAGKIQFNILTYTT